MLTIFQDVFSEHMNLYFHLVQTRKRIVSAKNNCLQVFVGKDMLTDAFLIRARFLRQHKCRNCRSAQFERNSGKVVLV